MPVPARLDRYIETEKQRHFTRDFLVGWERYETWDEAQVGEKGPAAHTFAIAEEDVIAYNRSCGETHPLYIDAKFARENSPTGEVLQHPIFVTTLGFYTLGASGIGTWVRTPGARNPHQLIEIIEPFRSGEVITNTVTTADKFVQRGKHYLQILMEFHNQTGALKATWLCSLILPPTRADVAKFANA